MTERDTYIIVKRTRADAFRSAAAMIDPTYQRNGRPVHSALIGAAGAAEDAAEWAETKTAKEFRSERYKP